MEQESIIPKIRQETRRVKISFELKKDLQDDEVICENCHGTGLDIADNVYGIQGDITHIGVHFPYKHQSISFCKYCYNGVLRKCHGCGSLRGKNTPHDCPCGYHKNKHRTQRCQKDKELWDKAEKISQSDAFNRFGALYIDNMDRYVYDEDDLAYAVDDYMDDMGDGASVSDLRIYGTTTQQISLDAVSVTENALDDLHEDAGEACDYESLQRLLDDWCKEQTGTETYYPDYNIGVILDERTD